MAPSAGFVLATPGGTAGSRPVNKDVACRVAASWQRQSDLVVVGRVGVAFGCETGQVGLQERVIAGCIPVEVEIPIQIGCGRGATAAAAGAGQFNCDAIDALAVLDVEHLPADHRFSSEQDFHLNILFHVTGIL